jgi:membrane protease YdiL (CAAX protease family)
VRDAAVRRFVILLILFSGVFYAAVLLSPAVRKGWLSYSPFFMWCPGAAALLTQWSLQRNVRGLGWRLGSLRYYAFAFAFPLAFCIPVYAAVWMLGLGSFDADALAPLRARFGLPSGVPGNVIFLILAGITAPLGIVATLGEELGWRGFLVPRLASRMDPARATLLIGALWALWHLPVQYAVLPLFLPHLPFWYASACFTISVLAISFVYTWLRLRSGSVWPAALLHATSNGFQGAFESVTRHNELTSYFTYEFGLGFALILPLLAIPFFRSMRAAPAGADSATPP